MNFHNMFLLRKKTLIEEKDKIITNQDLIIEGLKDDVKAIKGVCEKIDDRYHRQLEISKLLVF